jgi:uncharacterized membrane protein
MGGHDPARRHGYVQTVHPGRLLPLAEQLDVTVQIVPLVGEHVVAGRPIAHAWRTSPEQPPPDPAALAGPVQDAVRISYQRTLQQDVRFGLRQLVDIALRALSPAVNDPYTAIQAIHPLTVLLCALAPARSATARSPEARTGHRVLLLPAPCGAAHNLACCGHHGHR